MVMTTQKNTKDEGGKVNRGPENETAASQGHGEENQIRGKKEEHPSLQKALRPESEGSPGSTRRLEANR